MKQTRSVLSKLIHSIFFVFATALSISAFAADHTDHDKIVSGSHEVANEKDAMQKKEEGEANESSEAKEKEDNADDKKM